MTQREEEELKDLQREIGRRQRFSKNVPKIGETLAVLLAKRGYLQAESANSLRQAWDKCVGEKVAKQSLPGNVQRGTLEVHVASSALVQELTFQKKQLVKKLTELIPDFKIKDLRFRVGPIT
jgi:predicted nucleic acid-binding Zn ribbon protein